MGTDLNRIYEDPPAIQRYIWGKTILLTALASTLVQVGVVILSTLNTLSGNTSQHSIPLTFHTLWEVVFFVLCFHIARRIGLRAGAFFAGIILCGFISGIIWFLLPNSIELFPPRYYGLESRLTQDSHTDGRYDEYTEYDYPLSKEFLYKKDDPKLKASFSELSMENDFVGTKGFLFWQTGLANGYYPSRFLGHKWRKDIWSRLVLFFTVGPLVIIEAIIIGSSRHFPIFMLFIILWNLIKKENIWFSYYTNKMKS